MLAFAAPAAACEGADVRPAAGNTFALGQTTESLINEQRAANGLGPLGQNALLAVAAAGHNHNMIVQSFFDHTGRDGQHDPGSDRRHRLSDRQCCLDDRREPRLGNRLVGQPARDRQLMDEVRRPSPQHQNTDFREIGIAVEFGVPDRALLALPGATYTTEFGTVAPPPASAGCRPGAGASGQRPPPARRSPRPRRLFRKTR